MPSGPHATLWARGGTAQDLGTLPGHAVNESGDIVGSSGNLQQRRAVLWAQGGAIRDLGTLPGGASSRALGISKGEVVGTSETSDGEHAFLDGGRWHAGSPTNTAEVIDLTKSSPTWQAAAPMAVARRQLNATLLPDGTVLVTGGTSKSMFNTPDDTTSLVHYPEIWNPATGLWNTTPPNPTTTTLARSSGAPRIYHSSAVLLPDARVLIMGGNGQLTSEIYSPPYLFNGARPTIGSALPQIVAYGQTFSVPVTSDVTQITKVTMLRLSSVTHAFNMSQYISTWTKGSIPSTLNFSQVAGGLNLVAPSAVAVESSTAPAVAPPGHYMLFILNGSGVPSEAKIVQLATLDSIAVTPANPTIQAGKTQQFTATGTYLNGRTQDITNLVAWTSSNTTVATITTPPNGSGLATGVSAGNPTIFATLSLSGTVMTGSTTLTVQAAPAPTLTSIAVTPANPTIQTGTTQQFAAEGTYSDNSKQIITNLVAWASSNAAAAISATGLATGVSAGSPTISATLSGVTGSTVLTVQASPASLTITTTSLPDARVGFVYSSAPQLQASGGDEAVCMVVQPAQPDEPVASSPGFIIEPGHWSDQRDADIGGIDECSIPLNGEGD